MNDQTRRLQRDKLILLRPNFRDPHFPNRPFYCWHCALMEGVLALYPELKKCVDVKRIGWTRPRLMVIELLGEGKQSLPVLVLADGADPGLATGSFENRLFVEGTDAILTALAERHGIPQAHP